MVKLIVVDLDDTLIGLDLRVSKRNTQAVRKAQSKRIQVTLATGRTFQTAEPFAKKLGLTLPVICYNGALVRNTHKVHIEKMLPEYYYPELVDFAKRNKVQLAFYVSHHSVIFFNRPLDAFAKEYLDKIEQVSEITLVNFSHYSLPRTPIKAMLISTDKRTKVLEKRAKAKWGDKMYITITRPNLLEFLNPEINKGTAVEYIAKMLKIPLWQTMAIGDGMNDIPMLQRVRYSVAVKNAPAAVEKEARYVVSSWEKDGVAEAIEWAIRHNAKKQ
ncbi:MAG: Cof-type HAD-IIB family hydrolase [Patescibacteria group bacterium]